MRKVSDCTAGTELTNVDTVVAAADVGVGRGPAFVLGTQLFESLLGELHGGQESAVLGPELMGGLEAVETEGKCFGLLLEGVTSASGVSLPFGGIGHGVAGDSVVGFWDVFLQVSEEFLVAASFEVDGGGELAVDFKGGLFGCCHDPLTVELEEVFVEDKEVATVQ